VDLLHAQPAEALAEGGAHAGRGEIVDDLPFLERDRAGRLEIAGAGLAVGAADEPPDLGGDLGRGGSGARGGECRAEPVLAGAEPV